MYDGINLKPPIFEMGLKGYLYGKKALEFAKAADCISKKYEVSIIFDPQYVDIPKIVEETENLYIFAQHMDSIEIGRGIGRILPEALKEAGVVGTILNHAERKILLSEIYKTIKKADDVGLATLVCADSPQEAAAVAQLNPNIVLAEPPQLIGTGKPVGKLLKDFISETVALVKKINPEIIICSGAGIRDAKGVKKIIRLGAEATGSTSAILKADDPVRKLEEMIKALKEVWLETHPG
ncbi:MAG: triose-phosphate isomerase [Candidatus Hydromicrobium americanum]|nr:MAG: triose-phosphate isomerase [Candidatus Hydromicrobium americanum]